MSFGDQKQELIGRRSAARIGVMSDYRLPEPDDTGSEPNRIQRYVTPLVLSLALSCAPSTPSPDNASQAPNGAPHASAAGGSTTTPPNTSNAATGEGSSQAGVVPAPLASERPTPPSASALDAHPPTAPSASPFAPPPFAPPHPATAAPGDGTWTPMGDAESDEPAANPPRVVFRSTVHPHDKNRFIALDVVAIDLRQVEVHWIIGKKDDGATRLQSSMTPGLIPDAHQPEVLAVFNGGFQARHGWWGMMSNGVTVLAAKEHGCTVALTPDGVRIAPWSELGVPNEQLLAFRQTPPCLVHEGQIHEQLVNGSTRVWAGHNPDRKTRRRSAIGIDAERRVLYFAIGTETGPLDLARGMRAVGAHNTAQLDINWAWTRFLLAGRRDGKPRITSSLVADPLHGKNEYFSRASDRDFFYIKRRGKPGAPP